MSEKTAKRVRRQMRREFRRNWHVVASETLDATLARGLPERLRVALHVVPELYYAGALAALVVAYLAWVSLGRPTPL